MKLGFRFIFGNAYHYHDHDHYTTGILRGACRLGSWSHSSNRRHQTRRDQTRRGHSLTFSLAGSLLGKGSPIASSLLPLRSTLRCAVPLCFNINKSIPRLSALNELHNFSNRFAARTLHCALCYGGFSATGVRTSWRPLRALRVTSRFSRAWFPESIDIET